MAVPVQSLLCLLELSVDGRELALNQRLLHVEHRAHHLQPDGGRKRKSGEKCTCRKYHFNKKLRVAAEKATQEPRASGQDVILIKATFSGWFPVAVA